MNIANRLLLNIPYQPQFRSNPSHRKNHIADMFPNVHAEFLRGMLHFNAVGTRGKGSIFPFLFNGGRFEVQQ